VHYIEMERLIEQEVTSTILRFFPLDWKEDSITHDLMINLRSQFRHITLYGMRTPIELDWEIYKLHGKRETTYGDIGLLVRYRMPTGKVIEGAGFLEAKVRGRNTTKFSQVRSDQVARILSRSPQSRLVLYDYNPVAILDDFDFGLHRFHSRPHALVTHAPVLPLQLASVVNQYDDTLYRFCSSFSRQFTRRYFQMHDLDFTKEAVDAVKGFPGELGSPNIVMVVRIAAQGQELPEGFLPNDNTYGPIDDNG
jgi:hypothetical protein